MSQAMSVTATTAGADITRECGCTERLDPDWDAWLLVEQCAAHAADTVRVEEPARRTLDHELDIAVHEHAGGKRVDRIMPRDPTRRR